jgi:hypothetical protein
MDSVPFFAALVFVAWLVIWFVRQEKKPSGAQTDGAFAMRRPVQKPAAGDRRGRPAQTMKRHADLAARSAADRGRHARTSPTSGGHPR